MAFDTLTVLADIDEAMSRCRNAMRRLPETNEDVLERMTAITLAKQIVDRFAEPETSFRRLAEEGFNYDQFNSHPLNCMLSALQALRIAYEKGYLQTLQELIHANLFSDFLDQAEHLLENKYKDAAAVMAGGVLEEHLRKLCSKASIETTFVDANGKTKHKMIDALNNELAKANVYGRNDQKQVTAWADLRNDAAHGHYEKYNQEQVGLMVQGLKAFLSRHPA